jgi:hypothetical protein
MTRTDRLFEIYETSTDAARSFSFFLPNTMRQTGTTSSHTPPPTGVQAAA